MYIVNFTVPILPDMPKAYNDATNYSRIFIEFPTKMGNTRLFEDNLGGYQGLLYERVGCSFDSLANGTQYVLPITTSVL